MSDAKPLDYAQAGVDIDAGNALVERIKPLAKKTTRPEVMTDVGGFNALFALDTQKYQQPVLVSATDGVGTKLKLALEANKHNSIGIDLVAMCVNDLITCGADPLFFLDYFATAKLDVDVAEQVVAGIADGCLQAGAALVGGETAEMPGLYQGQDYDLAGFCVGVVEKEQRITGQSIQPGDHLIALASSGPHANGYSLVRHILKEKGCDLQGELNGAPLLEQLLTPTRIYVKTLAEIKKAINIKGMSHITGGGLLENVPRMLPQGLSAALDTDSWQCPAIFDWLQSQGNVADQEMWRTFNNGVGMVICVSAADSAACIALATELGEQAWVIGDVVTTTADEKRIILSTST